MLGALATLRIKHNPTAINRRQADQGLTTFLGGINRRRGNNLTGIGKVSRRGAIVVGDTTAPDTVNIWET